MEPRLTLYMATHPWRVWKPAAAGLKAVWPSEVRLEGTGTRVHGGRAEAEEERALAALR